MSLKIQVQFTEQPIDPAKLGDQPPPFSHGAELLFLGKIRNSNLGKCVQAVSYDAFTSLAEQILQKICLEAQERWGNDLKIVILHRIGTLQVGDISVAILTTSPHRDESYQASRYLIEQIKHRVPIWKKEHYLDGESEWLKGHALCSTH